MFFVVLQIMSESDMAVRVSSAAGDCWRELRPLKVRFGSESSD
jgi:hypothetical protein